MALNFLNDGYFAGKVGIGTNSPDRKLHVKDVNIVVSEFEGTNTGSLMDLVNSNSSQLYNGIRFTQGTTSKMAITHIADGTTKGYIQIGNSWATGSEILVVDGRTSNVGIGTTGPTEKLDVSGTAIVRSTLFTAGNVHGFTSSYGASFFINNGGGTSYFNATGGNVGIGTTSPTQKLHVAGNLRVTGAYYDSNNAPGTLDQVLTSTATGVAWVDPGTITAEAATLVVIECKNTSGATITKGTPVYQTGTVGVTDVIEIAPADALISSGKQPAIGLLQTTLNNNGFGKVVITGEFLNFTTDPIDGVTPTTGDKIFLKSGGGLTLTKPTGEGNGIQNLGLIGKVSGGNAGSITVSSIMRTNDVPNLPTGKIWVGDGNTIVSDTVFLDETNGRMGIGTTSPTNKLDIRQSTSGGSDVLGTGAITIGSDNPYWTFRGTATSLQDLAFDRNYSGTWYESMRIQRSTGNVGIGRSSSITARLFVEGPVDTSTISTSSTPAARINNGGAISNWIGSNGYNYGYIQSIQDDGSNNLKPLSLQPLGGNVGIGETSPGAKLHVKSTSATGANFILETTHTGGIPLLDLKGAHSAQLRYKDELDVIQGRIDFGDSGTFNFIDVPNNNSTLYLKTGGNVGIGVTAPTSSVHVNGLQTNSGSTSAHNPTGTMRLNFAGASSADEYGASLVFTQRWWTGSTGEVAMGQITGVKETGDGNYGGGLAFFTSNNTGNNLLERLRINELGNVGIGVTNPSDYYPTANDLVLGGNANNGMTIASTNVGAIHFADGSTGAAEYAGYIAYQHSDNKMRFGVNESDKLVILSGGNVGIGTTLPGSKLTVSGSFSADTGFFSNELTLASNLRLQSNITILNKAQTSYISFATRNTSGSEAVMDLTNVGSINGGAAGPYLALAGNTTATAMTGDIILANQKQVRFLTSGNLVGLRLQSSGTSSFIDNEVGDMYFRQEADGNNIFFQADDGSGGNTTYFSVRPNNGARTQFEKNTRHNDGIKAFFGTGEDLQIYHDGTNSHIDQNVSGNLYIKNSIVDGDILFQGDDGSGTAVTNYFTINGGGGETRFQKNTRHNDGVKAQFGNSDDLQIYHDNTNSYSAVVDVGTGYLLLGTDGPFVLIGNSTATETYIKANNNSSVDLYFDNSKKFETTSAGVAVTGKGTSSATITSDGSSTLTTKGYVDSLITGATIYRGTWDPDVSLNSGYGNPNLNTVTQTSGYYYICSADGAATPNGTGNEPDSWNTGDWVIWNDDIGASGEWQKIDNSSVLSGVGTGQTVALWEGASSVTDSETLGNAPITVSGNNTTFAGSIYANTIYSATNSAYYIDVNATAVGLNMAGDINLAAGKKLQYSANSFMTPENNVSGAEISTAGTFIVKTGSTPTLGLTLDASQNATFAGKATSSSTVSTDAATTLVTKDYVDSSAGNPSHFRQGHKSHNLTNAFTTCLTVSLSNHTGCYVTVCCFGDWGSHSSAAYRGEFFLQNGANSYNEPGIILRQDDNTSNGTDQIVCQILDPTGSGNPKDFEIQIRTTATTGTTSFTGLLTFTVQGQFNSVT